jgi:F0F1-type ATP synthase assembly protein I
VDLCWLQNTISGGFEPPQRFGEPADGVRSMEGWRMANKNDGNENRNLGKYLELAILLPISTMVGYGIGYFLDRYFGTHFLYLIFLVLGSAAGIIQLIRELS